MNYQTGVEINNLLDKKKDEFLAQLKIAQEIKYPSGRRRIESDNSQLHRLEQEYMKLTMRSQGFESYIYMFHVVLENARTEIPRIPEVELFEYALDQFEGTRSRSPIVSEEVSKWCRQPIEKIIEEYALLLAYQLIIAGLKVRIKNSMMRSAEPDGLADAKSEETEASYFAILGSKKEAIITAIAEFLIDEDYINNLDIEIVKRHFFGEYGLPKMNFTKDLSLLIKLLGDLSKLFHSGLLDKHFKTVRYQPVTLHFLCEGKKISNSNWVKTRTRNKGVNGIFNPSFRPVEKFTAGLLKVYCPS